MRTLTKTLLFLCLLVACVAAASAQPAVNAQSVQDFINSAQSGHGTPDGVPPSGETICAGQVGAAHGLCTAYCEAMDCDSANPQASPTACSKVRANYIKHTGQAPPCDCPCVTQLPGWIEAVNGPIQACGINNGPGDPRGEFVVLGTSTGFPISIFAPGFAGCGFFPVGPVITTTDQQARTCNDLLKQRAAAAGVQCLPL